MTAPITQDVLTIPRKLPAGDKTNIVGLTREALRDALVNHKVKHEYYVGGDGGHDWGTWRHLLYVKILPGLWRNK